MLNKKNIPYSNLEIMSHRRYVMHKYRDHKIRPIALLLALIWFLINKYYKKMETKRKIYKNK